MISYSFYESDNRVIRYAEALAKRGDHVDVLSLRRNHDQPETELSNGVNIHRLQDRLGKNETSSWSYLWPILRFLVTALRWINAHGRTDRFDLVHVHNIPDFLVFAAWPAKRRGAKLILDIHDIVPEFFGSKFSSSDTSAVVTGLRWVERISARFAHHVILSNHLWLERYAKRSASKEKCSVFINHVDRTIFTPSSTNAERDNAAPIVMFPGGLQWHQGLDIAIRAVARLRTSVPNIEFHIYGEGNAKPDLINLVHELQLNDSVKFHNPQSLREIARTMTHADLGVVPKRADSFGNEAYSTKIMEFMSLGIPVVAAATAVDRFYFNDRLVRFFEPGNDSDLATAMLDVLTNRDLRRSLISNALEFATDQSWDRHKVDYLALVDRLVANT